MSKTIPGRLRCALYTRKSTEEGLEQSFNTLHAQREACEAYVRSQKGEGWSVVKTLYDDGGFSGGSMDRPALKQLLQDIDGGLIDVVVVYKVDRLTRSLTDFAKIVERFDARGVSFVSVTQAFNTTTSMGRLTLNVLLSFAQFEREVTGERIRDKIAASKRKGMWMGGGLPFGYDAPTDLQTRALAPNPDESVIVREMFARYLQVGSVHELARELQARGVLSKVTLSSRGVARGGVPFSRGALFHLLKNRVYIGRIVHKAEVFPGAHAPIVDDETFEAVQVLLAQHAQARRDRSVNPVFALTGRVFDADGFAMSPTSVRRRLGKIYRYYVSAPLQQGGRVQPGDTEAIRRVSAQALEDFVHDVVAPLVGERLLSHAAASIRPFVKRAVVGPRSISLTLDRTALDGATNRRDHQIEQLLERTGSTSVLVAGQERDDVILSAPIRLKFWGGRTWLVGARNDHKEARVRVDRVMIDALRAGHAILKDQGLVVRGAALLHEAKAPASTHGRKLCRLALLAPDLQAMILEGRQASGVHLDKLLRGNMPLAWADQRLWLSSQGGPSVFHPRNGQ